jgi:hypothetical protein
LVSLQKRMELRTDVMLASPSGVMLASPAAGQLRDVG